MNDCRMRDFGMGGGKKKRGLGSQMDTVKKAWCKQTLRRAHVGRIE